MAAHIADLAGRVRFAAEEGAGFEMEFGISCLGTISILLSSRFMRQTDIGIFKDGHNKDV